MLSLTNRIQFDSLGETVCVTVFCFKINQATSCRILTCHVTNIFMFIAKHSSIVWVLGKATILVSEKQARCLPSVLATVDTDTEFPLISHGW
jgi:hypothetical protein